MLSCKFANFQYATIYNKKVIREEAELFDQPSYSPIYDYM